MATQGFQGRMFLLALTALVAAGLALSGVLVPPDAFPPSAQAQGRWVQVTSPVTTTLWAVDAVSPDAVWAVGERGVILRWDGTTWSKEPSPTDYSLVDVDMYAPDVGWAVGTDVLNWDGQAWEVNEEWVGYDAILSGPAPFAWAGSGTRPDNGSFFLSPHITEWTGTEWRDMPVPDADGRIEAMDGDGDRHAWAVGPGGLGEGITLQWNGTVWRRHRVPTEGSSNYLNDVDIVDYSDTWCVGSDGLILHWDGTDWEKSTSPTTNSLQGLDMLSRSLGFAVGIEGTMIHWDGNLWSVSQIPTAAHLYDIAMVSPSEGWAVGADGTILRYTDPTAPTSTATRSPGTALPSRTPRPTETPTITPNATATQLAQEFALSSYAVAVEGNYAYLGVGKAVDVLDITDRSDPKLVGRSEWMEGTVSDIALSDGRAYVALGAGGVTALDITNPKVPLRLGTFKGTGSVYDVVAGNSHAFVIDNVPSGDPLVLDTLRAIDFSNPLQPVERDTVEFTQADGLALSGRDLFVATSAIDEVEFHFMLSRFNVSTPSNMRLSGSTSGTGGYAVAVATGDGYAYTGLVNRGAHMQVVDAQDFFDIEHVQFLDLDRLGDIPFADVNDIVYRQGHVFISGSFLSLNFLGGGIRSYGFLDVVDVRDPVNPSVVGRTGTSPEGLALSGDHLLGTLGIGGGMYVYDITQPADPKVIGAYYPAKLEAVTPQPTRVPTAQPTPVPSTTPIPRPCTEPEWTMLVYLNGDNDLEAHVYQLFNTLEAAADNQCLRIRALLDGQTPGDTALYDVQPDDDPFVMASYQDGVNRWPKGELNMGNPQTLIDFGREGFAALPSEHRFLAIVDHGNGWSPNLQAGPAQFTHAGLSFDDSAGPGAYLSTSALANAFGVITQNGREPIDVLFFDACLMAMIENSYPLRYFADYLVVSQNLSYTSYPYDQYFDAIQEGTNPEAMAISLVDNYHDSLVGFPRTMAVIDLAQSERVAVAVDGLARALGTQLDAHRQEIDRIFKEVQKFDSNVDRRVNARDNYVDLYDLARHIRDTIREPGVEAAAQRLLDAFETADRPAVRYERHDGGVYNFAYADLARANGLSIYLPLGTRDRLMGYYNGTQLAFAKDTAWDELIARLVAIAQPPGEPDPEPIDPEHRPGPLPLVRPVFLPIMGRGMEPRVGGP